MFSCNVTFIGVFIAASVDQYNMLCFVFSSEGFASAYILDSPSSQFLVSTIDGSVVMKQGPLINRQVHTFMVHAEDQAGHASR